MSDPRFTRLKTDPRFRHPKLKQTRVVIDHRFKSVLENAKKKNGPKVDKYGRPVSAFQQGDNLRRYYRLEDDPEDVHSRNPDLARGEVVLESSDEETSGSDSEGFVTLGGELEIDLDEEDHADQTEALGNDEESIRTSRLAIVNLDWDHVRAQHLFKICSSLVSPSAPSTVLAEEINYARQKGTHHDEHAHPRVLRGQVRSVCVYPSEFGKGRMEREEKEGPPKEIFKKNRRKDEEVNEKTVYEVGDGEECDGDALRRYQLERLRYYYAIVDCDTVQAATHIYNELEGTELERSANVFDLSFVPEDMTFEGEPRDEATEDLNMEYRPVEFVTDALRHSKVKLTWDDDDPERHRVTRRALTKREIEEGDYGNYVAGSSGESSDDEGLRARKKGKKAERDKLRALLLGGNGDEMPEGWDAEGENDKENLGDVDMEITFMPALSKKVGEGDETTLERYQRKVREKRKKRKDKGEEVENEKDEFFEVSEGESGGGSDREEKRRDKSKKRTPSETGREKPDRKEATAAELALLVASDKSMDEPTHFNIKSVIKAERSKKRKGKGKRGMHGEEDNEAQESFVMNVKDERFKALFEDHQFAVDPSNPHFKKTKAMTAILEERQKRRRERTQKAEEIHTTAFRRKGVGLDDTMSNSKSLQNLVESVKRKSANADLPGVGKRRKL